MEIRWNLPSVLFISLVLHVMTSLSFMGLISLFPSKAPAPEITEIEILPPQDQSTFAQQIVRQADVPENVKELENNQEARFLSEQKQRVKIEQQAKLNGKTQNSAATTAQNKKLSLKDLTQTSKDVRGYQDSPRQDPDGDRPTNKQNTHEDFQHAMNKKQPIYQPQQPSTLGESLPMDLAVGPMTALNTDRLTYYSFYARIEDLIRYRWESRIWSAIESYDQNYLRTIISQRSWVTHAEFLIRPDGKLVQATLMKPSGIQKFDQAAINAFKDAAIFPNPPKELIQSDGLIHLKYSFNVTYRR